MIQNLLALISFWRLNKGLWGNLVCDAREDHYKAVSKMGLWKNPVETCKGGGRGGINIRYWCRCDVVDVRGAGWICITHKIEEHSVALHLAPRGTFNPLTQGNIGIVSITQMLAASNDGEAS